MTTDSATFDLPPVMTLEDCQDLHAFLQQSRGIPIALNCAAVTRVTGPAAQMMQFAAQVWEREDVGFTLADPSEGFVQTLETLGMASLLDQEGVSA